MKQHSRFQEQISFVDDLSGLTNHTLDAIAFSSEKSIASIVLLMSTIPEYFGMVQATSNVAISITAACVSLVVVKLALREKPIKCNVPFMSKATFSLPVFWLLYLVQIAAGIAFIAHSGAYIDIGLIAISAVGAVCSERIAAVIKAEMKERGQVDLQSAKDAIKLNELRRNSEIRVATKEFELSEKLSSAPIDVDHLEPAAITEGQRERGHDASKKTRQTAAQVRQMEIYNSLVENHLGEDVDELNKSELSRLFGVSSTTINRDIKALRDAGHLNGTVA